MVLVDTSAWVEFLRSNGRKEIADRVYDLLLRHQAAWCEIIQLELWNGIGGDADRKRLDVISESAVNLEINVAVWARSLIVARKARENGLTVPTADLLIAACAFHHGVEIESSDKHFLSLAKLR